MARQWRIHPLLAVAVAAYLLVATCLLAADGQGAPPPGPFSLLNQRVPEFSVTDTGGKVVSSGSIIGRTTVLFVFCSCAACRQLANEWAKKQHEPFFHNIPLGIASTLVVFTGDQKAAGAFSHSVDFDRASTTVACDPDLTMARIFRSMPCPSVYVVDAAGVIRYSSKELAPPKETSPSILLGQTLNLLTAFGGPGKPTAIDATPIATNIEASPGLTPIKDPGLEVIEGNGLLWQADDIRATSVTREFSFRNDRKVAIEIRQIQASCGCGAVTLSKNGKQVTSTVVDPGETVKISVITELGDGPISKVVYIWLYSKALTSIGFAKISIIKAW